MEKLLFSHSYFLHFDPKQWATGQPYPPLATIGAAALMRSHGYKPSLFDPMFSTSPDEIIPRLETERPDILVLYDDGFNYLTKMCLTNMRDAAYRMIALGRQYGCTIVVSSSDSTDHYADYLAAGADFVLLGEGEQTLLELVNALSAASEAPDNFTAIHGLAFIQNGSLVRTPARSVMRDLDSLPLPAWDLIDMAPYREMWMSHHGYFSLNISTTRGCPFKCNWCAKPIYGNRYHARSPQHVVRELRLLKDRYDFDHIWFCDDIFGLKPGWVNDFAALVTAENLHFRFKIQSRADLLLQEDYVSALARAGCENSWMGAESGSQKILDAMDKGTRIEQIGAATRLLRQHGISPSFFIQFGYPGETREDIASTIRMINTLLPDTLGISVSYPLPGTVFYERVKKDLKEKKNWTDSDELQLMFRNAFAPAFYKQLHRYVHKSHRWHLAWYQLRRLLARPWSASGAAVRRALSIAWYGPSAWLAKLKLSRLENLNYE